MMSRNIDELITYSKHFAGLLNANARIVDVKDEKLYDEVFGDNLYFCRYCHNKKCSVANTYLYGCNEAYRWNGKYIYYCPEGLVFISASVADDIGRLYLGITLGPFILGDIDDTPVACDENAVSIPNISSRKATDISEILSKLSSSISGVSGTRQAEISFKQENFLAELYSDKYKFENKVVYPIDTEKKLKIMIANADKKGAEALLNELLGCIYFIADFQIETVKTHLLQLLVEISRAAIDAGADADEIIWFNSGCIKQMSDFNNVEDLSIWITEIMHRFIRYSFDFSKIKHSDTVYRVIDYIRNNYSEKLSLEGLAGYVNFSKTYLSRIFKEETGENISNYINKIRIEKSKLMLLDKEISLVDVANMAGFEDQSYYTKVFKNVVGTSPKKYRENKSR